MATTVTAAIDGNHQRYNWCYQIGPTTSSWATMKYAFPSDGALSGFKLTSFTFNLYCDSGTWWDDSFQFWVNVPKVGQATVTRDDGYSSSINGVSVRAFDIDVDYDAAGVIAYTYAPGETILLEFLTSSYAIASRQAAIHLASGTMTFETTTLNKRFLRHNGNIIYVESGYSVASVNATTSGTFYMTAEDYRTYVSSWGPLEGYVAVQLPTHYYSGVTYYQANRKALWVT